LLTLADTGIERATMTDHNNNRNGITGTRVHPLPGQPVLNRDYVTENGFVRHYPDPVATHPIGISVFVPVPADDPHTQFGPNSSCTFSA
jgi:hypothetical protein